MKVLRGAAAAALILVGSSALAGSPSVAQQSQPPQPASAYKALSQLAAVQQEVRSYFGGQPTYKGVDRFWHGGTSEFWRISKGVNTFGGSILVEPYGEKHEMFKISFTNLPKLECVELASADLGRGNTGKIIDAKEGPFNRDMMEELCQEGSAITWIFE